MIIDIYLAHRNTNLFFYQQVYLIRKFFKVNKNSQIIIYGYVDGNNDIIKEQLKKSWEDLNVIPIDIPNIMKGYDRNNLNPSDSFGLAFQYVYETYILKNKNISICMENDIMPYVNVNIEELIYGHEICGEIRFNQQHLPDRMLMFWLGFIIFNGEIMEDRELWNSETGQTGLPVKSIMTNNSYWMDCGGNSYNWIMKKNRKIKHIVTIGYENYDPYTSNVCRPHNITTDIHLLPNELKEYYEPSFRILIYKDLFIHLERMGKEYNLQKVMWWNKSFDKLIK